MAWRVSLDLLGEEGCLSEAGQECALLTAHDVPPGYATRSASRVCKPHAVRRKSPAGVDRLFPRNVRHEQSLEGLAVIEVALADLVEVGRRDLRIPDVVRLYGHGDPAAAVLETARLVHHHARAEPALLDQGLEPVGEAIGALLAARALGISGWARVRADEDLVLGLGHGRSYAIVRARLHRVP